LHLRQITPHTAHRISFKVLVLAPQPSHARNSTEASETSEADAGIKGDGLAALHTSHRSIDGRLSNVHCEQDHMLECASVDFESSVTTFRAGGGKQSEPEHSCMRHRSLKYLPFAFWD
jgi:hypothetical protein